MERVTWGSSDTTHASTTNSVAPELEGSSPWSPEPAVGPYPEPAEPTPHPANLPKNHSEFIFLYMPRSSERSFSFGISHQNPVHYTFLSSPMRTTFPVHLIPLILSA
jgi:hypothetical protein